ncbi:MAG TPA: glycosyltransferase [Candidatus Babeliaceae bacterium]|nr:glycosyltransferase [Candidatus Babeliaceae bacterium]
MNEFLFSVLVANYNNGSYIGTAIESVLRQSYKNWEIIIVDDASTDGSVLKLAPYLSDSRIRIFRNKVNFGCGYTKRRCIELASGTIGGFLDPDDALTEDAIEIMVDAHNHFPEASLCYSTHFICDETLTAIKVFDKPRQIPQGMTYLELSDGSISHFATFKMAVYRKMIGINPTLPKAVDQDLYYKLEEQGNLRFVGKPLYYYRIHTRGISTGSNIKEAGYWNQQIREDAYLRRLTTAIASGAGDIHNSALKYYNIAALNGVRNHLFRKFLHYSWLYLKTSRFSIDTLKYLRRVFLVSFLT